MIYINTNVRDYRILKLFSQYKNQNEIFAIWWKFIELYASQVKAQKFPEVAEQYLTFPWKYLYNSLNISRKSLETFLQKSEGVEQNLIIVERYPEVVKICVPNLLDFIAVVYSPMTCIDMKCNDMIMYVIMGPPSGGLLNEKKDADVGFKADKVKFNYETKEFEILNEVWFDTIKKKYSKEDIKKGIEGATSAILNGFKPKMFTGHLVSHIKKAGKPEENSDGSNRIIL